MSEYRYFLRRKSGEVFNSADPLDAFYTGSPEHYTEVQVVPLDAIVIDRADLPEVHDTGRDELHAAGRAWGKRFDHRERALTHLALSEYQVPPADESQVRVIEDSIVAAISAGQWDNMTAQEQARYLVERGVRVEVSDA